jgi:hypothetical protein
VSGRRAPKDPAPALTGTLDRIRRGRAGNEALEALFAAGDTGHAPVGPAGDDAGSEPGTVDRVRIDPVAVVPATRASADATTADDRGPEPPTGSAALADDHEADEPASVTARTAKLAATEPAPGPPGAGGSAVADVGSSTPGAAGGTSPRRATHPGPTKRTSGTNSSGAGQPAPGPPPTTGGGGRRQRPSGVPFTVLLNRHLRTKVQAWVLANRRLRQRPSNSVLIQAAAARWDPERTDTFLDWFDRYEPIGMATPDASRFAARVPAELVDTLELVCAELTIEHDLRIPRQALMMFLLEEELDHQTAQLHT